MFTNLWSQSWTDHLQTDILNLEVVEGHHFAQKMVGALRLDDDWHPLKFDE